jgi:hypothetical protein
MDRPDVKLVLGPHFARARGPGDDERGRRGPERGAGKDGRGPVNKKGGGGMKGVPLPFVIPRACGESMF